MKLTRQLTERLGIRFPILLAPMAEIAGGRLAGVEDEELVKAAVHLVGA